MLEFFPGASELTSFTCCRCLEMGCNQKATHKQTKSCNEHHNRLEATASTSFATKRKCSMVYKCPICQESFGSIVSSVLEQGRPCCPAVLLTQTTSRSFLLMI